MYRAEPSKKNHQQSILTLVSGTSSETTRVQICTSSLFKTFQIKESITVGVGATAFNVFNHPNFNLPDFNLGDATFGQITSMQGVPTSPYGNSLGFDSSVRVVQLSAKLNF